MSTERQIEEKLVRQLTTVIETHRDIRLAILYGSYARGGQRPDSDVDLGVAKDPYLPIDYDKLLDLSLECSRASGREVQIRDLARANGVFLKEVLTKGIVIFSKEPRVRAELIIRMLDFVEDMLPNVRMIRRRNRERLIAGE